VRVLASPHFVLTDNRYTGDKTMPGFSAPSTRQIIGRALLAGVASGLRSSTPLGVMAAERNDASFRAGWKEWPVFRSDIGRVVLQLSWLGEVVVDKTPVAKPRTEPGSLIGRGVSGAIAGMAVGTERKDPGARLAGTTAGILGSIAGSLGGYAYRTKTAKATGLPDLPLALVEDIAAYALARKGIKG
jgi:uncharacterized membrane protein